jgi:hypothetical protein
VSTDEHHEYLHVIDSDVNYFYTIGDNFITVSDENEPDSAESSSELEAQQQGYYSLINDDLTYQEIAGEVSNNPQVDEQNVHSELYRAQTTSTSETPFITAAHTDKLQ